ncbi:hypothetical protein D3C87_1873500 [compost metagenome]
MVLRNLSRQVQPVTFTFAKAESGQENPISVGEVDTGAIVCECDGFRWDIDLDGYQASLPWVISLTEPICRIADQVFQCEAEEARHHFDFQQGAFRGDCYD